MGKPNKRDIKNREQVNKVLSSGQISEILGKDRLKNLFTHVDISSIIFFRIAFGILMFIEVIRYFDRIERYWLIPKYHFSYLPFDFITPFPGNGMYILFGFMLVFSVLIIAGLFYRISMILFFLSFTYVFLLEQSRYLNHFYLIILISFVMIFIPANKTISFDRKIFKTKHSETCEAWSLWLLRFMIALPYFFGGIAKINGDWLQGEPLGVWFSNNSNDSVFNDLLKHREISLFMAYFSLLFDLLIVPFLLNKKTRMVSFLIAVVFHLINSQIFSIGIFPWFMIAATTIFFDPNWPRQFINFFNKGKPGWRLDTQSKEELLAPVTFNKRQRKTTMVLLIWVSCMITIPFRHLFIEGNVNWTEEGQKFSWFMKLRTKKEIATFKVMDKKSGEVLPMKISSYLRTWQKNNMQDKPNLIWQFCQFVKEDYKKKGIDVAVYANVKASLNGRKFQQLTDSTVDLASVPFDYFTHSKWILPLTIPLSDRLNESIDPNSNNVID